MQGMYCTVPKYNKILLRGRKFLNWGPLTLGQMEYLGHLKQSKIVIVNSILDSTKVTSK